jgi:hypothetical protein
MTKIGKIIIMAVVALCLTACGTTKSSNPYKVGSKLEIQMSDLQYLGESVISCEYDTYLGFIRHLVSVNGEEYVPGNDVKLNLPGGMLNFGNKGMRLAATKILTEYPDATYFQVVMETKETEVAFLGSSTKRSAKIRAYKFKN